MKKKKEANILTGCTIKVAIIELKIIDQGHLFPLHVVHGRYYINVRGLEIKRTSILIWIPSIEQINTMHQLNEKKFIVPRIQGLPSYWKCFIGKMSSFPSLSIYWTLGSAGHCAKHCRGQVVVLLQEAHRSHRHIYCPTCVVIAPFPCDQRDRTPR